MEGRMSAFPTKKEKTIENKDIRCYHSINNTRQACLETFGPGGSNRRVYFFINNDLYQTSL